MKSSAILALFFTIDGTQCFTPSITGRLPVFRVSHETELHSKGFGGPAKQSKGVIGKKSNRLADSLSDKSRKEGSVNRPFVKSEQNDLIEKLAKKAASTCIGRAVADTPVPPDGLDPFWELMPSLISSRFSNIADSKLQRVAGMVRHALDPNLPLEDSIVNDPYRPHGEIHAYMPGLGETRPFYDTDKLKLCQLLSENYDTIKAEYHALIADKKDRFQSVTSMNYDSGWRTLVLFYNGHRIPEFPYHLCPTTTRILETVPLAGRVSGVSTMDRFPRIAAFVSLDFSCDFYSLSPQIAGFNQQKPNSEIPLHSDGNNMWYVRHGAMLVQPECFSLGHEIRFMHLLGLPARWAFTFQRMKRPGFE